MNTTLLAVLPALRAELLPALADAPAVAELLAGDKLAVAHGPVLTQYIATLDEFLRLHRTAPRAVRLQMINLRHALSMRREADELQANPAILPSLQAAASRFAPKAQSGFSSTEIYWPHSLHSAK